MRALSIVLCGLLAAGTVQAEGDAAATVALINTQLTSDPFYATDGYSVALPSVCVVELIPRGSRFGSARKVRLALNVMDRSAVERLRFGPRGESGRYGTTWIDLVGRPEGTSFRRGFPATPELNEKGFPKDDAALLSYGIELRLASRDSARVVARAFVYLATLCLDTDRIDTD
ncbi:MAG: hypothetical protein ABW034_15130 [Steroidobacteraceae bacterium]